jgi:hypothetical protein
MTVHCHNDLETDAVLAKAKAEGRRVLRMARGKTNAAWTFTLSEPAEQAEMELKAVGSSGRSPSAGDAVARFKM